MARQTKPPIISRSEFFYLLVVVNIIVLAISPNYMSAFALVYCLGFAVWCDIQGK